MCISGWSNEGRDSQAQGAALPLGTYGVTHLAKKMKTSRHTHRFKVKLSSIFPAPRTTTSYQVGVSLSFYRLSNMSQQIWQCDTHEFIVLLLGNEKSIPWAICGSQGWHCAMCRKRIRRLRPFVHLLDLLQNVDSAIAVKYYKKWDGHHREPDKALVVSDRLSHITSNDPWFLVVPSGDARSTQNTVNGSS